MANEIMRIFFPLKIFNYPQYGCSKDECEDISPREAVEYEDQILAAITKENRHFENDRGLAEYIHNEALKGKVHSLYPSVEVVDGELWGVMTVGLKESLSGEETAALINYVCGQNADGYGECLEQRPIKTPDGEIYVSLWNHENYSLKLEQEMKNSSPDFGYGGQAILVISKCCKANLDLIGVAPGCKSIAVDLRPFFSHIRSPFLCLSPCSAEAATYCPPSSGIGFRSRLAYPMGPWRSYWQKGWYLWSDMLFSCRKTSLLKIIYRLLSP